MGNERIGFGAQGVPVHLGDRDTQTVREGLYCGRRNLNGRKSLKSGRREWHLPEETCWA